MKDRAVEFKKNSKDYTEGFRKVVLDPDLLDHLAETSGGKGGKTDAPAAPGGMRVFWDTLCTCRGWRLQRNYYFRHCRILDDYGRKKAAGGEEEMLNALKSIAGLQ